MFVLNGYEELENFHDLDESELDYLGITENEQRAKILAAVELLQDNSNTCKLHSKNLSGKTRKKCTTLSIMSMTNKLINVCSDTLCDLPKGRQTSPRVDKNLNCITRMPKIRFRMR